MAIDTMTIAQFIAENRISMTATHTDRNPSMEDSNNMDHWKCVLSRSFWEHGKRKITVKMTVTFSMGYGHRGAEPDAARVLSCLASVSSIVDDHSFDDWCAELGYDTDSRKALKIFKACHHMAKRLQNFLGVDLYGQILYRVETV
jgi:hypothetical protein